jgi:transposase
VIINNQLHISPQELTLILKENSLLKEENKKVNQENKKVNDKLNNLEVDNLYLKEELNKLKKLIFGGKTERFESKSNVEQLSLDFGFEPTNKNQDKEETIEVSYKKKKQSTKPKKKSIRAAIPSHLPRREEIIEPEEDTTGAKKIGELVTEVLEYEPGNIYVRKIVRPKYIKKEQENEYSDNKIVTAELPSLPIPKGNIGPGFLAHIYVSKFVDHLPYYRQIKQYSRQDLILSKSTINGWFNKGCDLIFPLYYKLKEVLINCDYLMGDETPIPVQDSYKENTTHKGYHWVYYSPEHKLVCFDYQRGRGREGPTSFLNKFKGTLQTDGYVAYDIFEESENITLLACMAHARRKFNDAINNNREKAEYALCEIQKLYVIERQARELGLSYAQRKELRQKEAVPILVKFEKWLKDNISEVLPKSSIGIAIAYTLKLWARLTRYVENGKYEIDNNLIENSIRPIALGRKNYLFAGSHEAAERAAMMYSFFGTCKINNVEPFAWLKDVLSRIQEHKANRLGELLPQNWQPLKV